MGRIDNLKANEVQALVRTVRRVSTTAPLGSTSVHNGQTRFVGTDSLKIEGSSSTTGTANVSGAQNISGTSTISGTQTVTGTTNQNGPVNISGTQTVTGILNQNGPWNFAGAGGISGSVSSTGTWTQTGNINVTGGGLVTVGGLVLDPTLNGLGGIRSSSIIYMNALFVVMSNRLDINGALVNGGITTSTSPANVFVDANGRFFKVTSDARFKIDSQVMELDDELLDVPFESWIDSESAERLAESFDAPRPWTKEYQDHFDAISIARVPGVVANKVQAAKGGEAFVTRGDDGEIESVAYDRFAIARTAILARKLTAALEQIEKLSQRLDELTA